MASYNSYIEEITEAAIINLNIKDLNKILKQKNIPKYESMEIKRHRRKSRMKKYRRDSRMRKPTEQELMEKKESLQNELIGIAKEVSDLRKEVIDLRLSGVLKRVDNNEYREFVVVDWAPELQFLDI